MFYSHPLGLADILLLSGSINPPSPALFSFLRIYGTAVTLGRVWCKEQLLQFFPAAFGHGPWGL